MISSVKQVIMNKLSELYPESSGYTIYNEDIPENFNKPSLLITLVKQDYSKRINKKYKSLLSFDLAFFSNKEVTEIKTDCLDVQLTLLRGLDIIGTFRVINKQATITDNVLHVTFDVNYSEINATVENQMQQQQTNTNL